MQNQYLAHFGIKGQRWGVRRFENEDGTLTPAGKERYGLHNRNGEFEVQRSAKSFYKYSKMIDKPFSDQIKEEKESGVQLSKRREKLIDKYKEKGLSQEDAELAAAKREKIEKTLKIAGGIAVTAAAAYGTYKVVKLIQDNSDITIPEGADIFRTTGSASEELDRAGFIAVEAKDAVKYKGIYGQQLQQQKRFNAAIGAQNVDPNVYQLSAKARGQIKVAGEGKGREVYERLMRTDPQFRSDAAAVRDRWEMSPMAKTGDSYRAFNQRLVDHDTPEASKVQKKFYDALKKEGYGGVIDTNDRHDSGYNAKKPVILFNMKENVTNARVRKLSPDEVNSSARKAWGMIAKSNILSLAVSATGLTAVGAGIKALSSISDLKAHELDTAQKSTSKRLVLQNYKKEHPGTKLSDKEILENELGTSKK